MQRKTMMHTKKVDPAVKLLQQVKFDVLKTSIWQLQWQSVIFLLIFLGVSAPTTEI